jgi:hypothetical protein
MLMFDRGQVCFISAPIWFPMEQLHCLESVVAMFYNVLFYVFPRSGFVICVASSTSRVSAADFSW